MNAWNTPSIRRRLITGYLSIIAVLLACTTSGGITATPVPTEAAFLRLENGAVEAREENGDWIPVGGETTFDIDGELESTDPWMVTGNTFAVRASTRIDEGLEAGNPVKVTGVILEDGTWLASSVEHTDKQSSSMIVLIGKVTSIAPWVVNGITLNVTSDTLISEGIATDMIVRVEILLLEDGTWEVISIVALADFTDVPGCATVSATVVNVAGNEIQLAGWPAITLNDNAKIESEGGDEAALHVDQNVLVVVCSSEGANVIITHIVILNMSDEDTPANSDEGKVLICHKPDKNGGHTLSISSSAVPAHLGHGDQSGPCP